MTFISEEKKVVSSINCKQYYASSYNDETMNSFYLIAIISSYILKI